jgi:hypothetical protein
MAVFLRNGMVFHDSKRQYDLRYFYVHEGRGYYTSGMVARMIIILLRYHRFSIFDSVIWSGAVKGTKNLAVEGIIAEQICLNRIASDGFRALSPKLTDLDYVFFNSFPRWGQQIATEKECRLYIPQNFNLSYIGGVILSLDFTTKQAEMFPIQFAMNEFHSNSEEEFCKSLWPKWSRTLQLDGYVVSLTFVRVVKDKLTSRIGETLLSGSYEYNDGSPKCTTKIMEIRDIDSNLANCF